MYRYIDYMDGATGRPHSLNGRFGVLLRQLQATGAADAQVPSGAPPIASRTSTSTVDGSFDRLTVALSARLPRTHCSQAVRHSTPHYLGTCTPPPNRPTAVSQRRVFTLNGRSFLCLQKVWRPFQTTDFLTGRVF